MKLSDIREKGLRAILGGETDLEYRDRYVGLTMTVIGLVAMAILPEAAEVRTYFTSNTPDTDLIYQVLFCTSFLALIGPCLMLPYRVGALPLVFAIGWTILQVNAEFNPEPTLAETAKQVLPAEDRAYNEDLLVAHN